MTGDQLQQIASRSDPGGGRRAPDGLRRLRSLIAGGCASFPRRPLISLPGPLFSPGLERRPPILLPALLHWRV
jgi:hypothetical protein